MARVGIDLGTTFSVVAFYDVDARRVEVIPDEETTQNLVPSAVYYPENGEPIVGWTALNMAGSDPDRLVRWIKMSMGIDFKKKIGDREYTPEDVSSEILKKLRRNAEIYLGEEVEEAVVTVPAYFRDAQRYATLKAAELAGWFVDWDNLGKSEDKSNVRLLAEPSAAALAYVVEAKTDLTSGNRNVLVSDLGGGTYDVTLLQTQPKTDENGNPTLGIKIVCKDGSRELGGKLWDDDLEDYVVKQCINQGHTDNPKGDSRLAFELRERVIRGKEMLSKLESTQIVCDSMGNTQDVSREKFEDLTAARLLEVETKLRAVLEEAKKEHGISLEAIDPILLVGGASKMPMVARRIEDVTGKQPEIHRTVDLLVAIGAAYNVYIGKIKTRTDIIIDETIDIPQVSVGVKVLVDRKAEIYKNAIVIEKGSDFGKEFVRDKLFTVEDNQPAIDFIILEGDSEDPDQCTALATVTLPLPPGQPAGTKVKVTLKYNESGIIVGSGVCFTSEGEKAVSIEIDRKKIAKV
jgi:molecular chaperone DnaK